MGAGASSGVNTAICEASDADLQKTIAEMSADDRAKLQEALQQKAAAGGEKKAADEAAPAAAAASEGELIFQLGTNNWQREGEFAPGSGILHEGHHKALNDMPGVKCYSMYPSKNQTQPTEADADFRVFKLEHDIPICESASPVSSKRWHSMSEDEFKGYVERLETEVYDFMKASEEKEGKKFTKVIAHHSFVNPLVMRNVIQKRVKEGLPKIPLYCFVHGTALKMYRWELGGKNTEEYPMRFHKMIVDEKLFDDQENGITACFVISQEQKGGIQEIFPTFPESKIIVSPNGINVEVFKPQEKSLKDVVTECTREVLWPAEPPSEETVAGYDKMIIFCGKFANWKRHGALLEAAASYEKDYPNLVTLLAGGGQPDDIKAVKDYADGLGLKNVYFIGGRPQPVLAELYTAAELGCFPSFKEPFGLVFVECMACKTPVIGANSGGPKDFVSDDVGCLVDEPEETTDLSTVDAGLKTMGKNLDVAIRKALTEDWKKTKGEACIKLAHDKFTVGAQVKQMLEDAAKLSSAAGL
eukprot:TRINITY_DN109_c0_g1_i1.p1 TRINITY_DN109_c0_g1~~TRINITY_DN109_c0_g1_i1.p1  ORF type:complete len:529 (+),score=208.93 TRINITY_DN109_c0_g1_i1:87-1673(+)